MEYLTINYAIIEITIFCQESDSLRSRVSQNCEMITFLVQLEQDQNDVFRKKETDADLSY